jgi:chloride channel protein, CIC family
MARDAFTGAGSLSLLLALKPLVTALCLGSGASGGLFTPTLSTGAVLGGSLGMAWSLAWPGSPSGAFAMVGAAMQAPLAGLTLVLELTHSGFGLMVPMMAATAVAFYVDGYSIYSARLRPGGTPGGWRSRTACGRARRPLTGFQRGETRGPGGPGATGLSVFRGSRAGSPGLP